jgi:hypothetical protein
MLAKFKVSKGEKTPDCGRTKRTKAGDYKCKESDPMERCLLNIPPPLGATAMQGAPDPRSRREEPLRWDLLSQGRGLFLKQTHPSTDRRLVSEPAARA